MLPAQRDKVAQRPRMTERPSEKQGMAKTHAVARQRKFPSTRAWSHRALVARSRARPTRGMCGERHTCRSSNGQA